MFKSRALFYPLHSISKRKWCRFCVIVDIPLSRREVEYILCVYLSRAPKFPSELRTYTTRYFLLFYQLTYVFQIIVLSGCTGTFAPDCVIMLSMFGVYLLLWLPCLCSRQRGCYGNCFPCEYTYLCEIMFE